PYGATSPAMNAVIAACKTGGLLPFANFNRIHTTPACNITNTQATEGLAILDKALDIADQHTT
ncbi:MAG: aspartate aminotransferase family protein, partial [Mycobacterium sp.]|nr:aspartate aminotransferase family protein [Mycobacterium sp.]